MEPETIEDYFIQFLYCKGNHLLRKEFRNLYDAMFEKYEEVYKEGKKYQQDLFSINDKFLANVFK